MKLPARPAGDNGESDEEGLVAVSPPPQEHRPPIGLPRRSPSARGYLPPHPPSNRNALPSRMLVGDEPNWSSMGWAIHCRLSPRISMITGRIPAILSASEPESVPHEQR